jgi:hypothetical protein
MQTLNTLLDVVARQMGLPEKARDLAALQLWPIIVPLAYQHSTQAQGVFRRGKAIFMRVAVKHPAVASELGFESENLVKALNHYSPQTGLVFEGIQLKVGNLEKT